MSRCPRVCIVGAGISGLSTAVFLQQSGVKADVTIIADKFSPNTTSDVAAGVWGPHAVADTPEHLVRRWSEATYKRYEKLYNSELCPKAGLTNISGYSLFETTGNDLNPFWKDLVKNFHVLSQTDLQQFPKMKEGYFFTTFCLETSQYLQWLTDQFKQHGGRMIQRKLSSLEEVAGDFDVVVNCSGVWARHLVNDKQIDSVRGQIIRFRAPWIKFFYIFNTDYSYLLPRVNTTVLGGTVQQGRWDDKPNDADHRDILQRGCAHIPSLKEAEIVSTAAGMRPCRTAVRLERSDDIHTRGRSVPVIHNYGHGGSGWTLHAGCAQDTVKLIQEAIKELPPKAKL